MVEELLGTENLLSQRGKVIPSESVSKVQVIGFLFLKNGCPFVSDMTSCLTKFYNKVNAGGVKRLEIVYCQCSAFDSVDEHEDDEFIQSMPWLILPKDDPRFFKISKQFQVKSKPRFILMTPNGVVLEENAERVYYTGGE